MGLLDCLSDSATLSSAYANVLVKLGIIQLVKDTFDICKEITQFGESCPISQGHVNLTKCTPSSLLIIINKHSRFQW